MPFLFLLIWWHVGCPFRGLWEGWQLSSCLDSFFLSWRVFIKMFLESYLLVIFSSFLLCFAFWCCFISGGSFIFLLFVVGGCAFVLAKFVPWSFHTDVMPSGYSPPCPVVSYLFLNTVGHLSSIHICLLCPFFLFFLVTQWI